MLCEDFFNKEDRELHCVESERFATCDAMMWQLRLEPGVWQEEAQPSQRANGSARRPAQRPTPSRLVLTALPSPREREEETMQRIVNVEFSVNGPKQERVTDADWEQKFEFISDKAQPVSKESLFYQFLAPKHMVATGLAKKVIIYFNITHRVQESAVRHLGLVNEGTTCYLNSLVQTLFFIREFRTAIYQVPTLVGFGEAGDAQVR